jgi:hypothetical protein
MKTTCTAAKTSAKINANKRTSPLAFPFPPVLPGSVQTGFIALSRGHAKPSPCAP